MNRFIIRPPIYRVICIFVFAHSFLFSGLGAQVFVINGPILPQLGDGAVAWADYDSDGDLDLLMSGADSAGIYRTKLLQNNGLALVPDLSQSLAQVSRGDADWADMDGDGDKDLVLTGQTGPQQYITNVYQNNSGNLMLLSTPQLPGLFGGRSVWSDLDGDGDQDLFLTGYNLQMGFVGMIGQNDGGGLFTAIQDSLYATRDWSTVGIGDYDADGLPDLAFGDISPLLTEGIRTEILHNVGGMHFGTLANALPDIYEGSLDFGDADGDGDLDLLCMGMSNKPNAMIFNYQSGQFQMTPHTLEGMGMGEAKWADFTADGHLDLITTGMTLNGPESRAYRWVSGNYTLFQGPSNMPQLYHSRLEWGDWNGDGYDDFVISGVDAADIPRSYIGTYNATLETFEF